MAVLDSPMRDMAEAVVDALGESAMLRRITTSYAPKDGEEFETTTNFTVNATPFEQFRLDQIDGTTVKRDDFMTTIAAKGLTIEPDPGTDFLIFGSVTYKLISVRKLYAGAQIAAFVLHCRK